ncbi:DUF72 domain-containing protein [Microbacterium terricola]|uniref:Sensor histidine kinase n=1 Tax=Microbacterium terricola TaxID=344163 RepID=A0ABM8E255_9MICO|nr:DUF72 domain-containing protein [Microbacterium terricola]UYK40403.1 DUF72 domain-containing protein [Microbacterium terricola]BDV31879.1 hypothetical protein Microterr_25390 [Microbacterium terricola]
MAIRIGTSGWSYDHWQDVLYPPGLPAHDRLARYVSVFDTVELNASFYRWPPASRFQSWNRRLPGGFAMTVKAPRGLTHGKRLYGPEAWLERMRAGWQELGDKRAVMLVQLPPTMERDDDRLGYFLERIPEWMPTAVELRHPSWNDEAVFSLLERHRAAYCVMSGAGLPCILRATSDVAYVRLHGPSHEHLYGGSYSDDDLAWWADRLREWSGAGRTVYAYFNNDGEGNAVRNALTLKRMTGT